METYRVYFADGDTLVTDMNATLEEAQRYYVGKTFNLGSGEVEDRLVKATKVETYVPRYCIHCKDIISGRTGDFLYEKTPRGLMAISPVFDNLVDFFLYLKEKGITNAKGPGAE